MACGEMCVSDKSSALRAPPLTRTAAERALAHLEFNYLPFLQGNPVRNKKVLLDVLENIQ